ncbi:ABC transporter ATP-binding protein [Solicola gregarius]|uniref:ABC transporter ATP-binding protein/permease n=1 Tax=Solicola gregarius TaxID=2908642 RepID=A0AA46TLJ1_9ACTN|nr:ABC transporter ATP-binding protein [Solicola gregarius]UYM07142.1 ABC transporter ATP-binding protein/permease [Solicola gregarius]
MPPQSVTRPPAVDARTRSTTSLWRLRGYLWPYRWRLVTMLVTALIGVFIALSIPLVTRAVIDGPIADRDRSGIVWLGLLALALGIVEAALILIRRWVQARAVLGVETAIRRDLYAHLNALPMEFHARWQSGQLLSRVTSDLSTIRRFSGFGMLFLIINIVQLIVTTVILLRLYWPLGLVVVVAAIPIIITSMRFERRYVAVSRRVQDEKGDVATQVEESALGIRVIKSFGRREYAFDKYDRRAVKLFGSSMDQVRLSARFWTFLEVLPNLALVLVLLLGSIAVGNDDLSLGTLVAFVTLMLSLIWPVEALGIILAMAQEAMTAADRVLEILDTAPSIVGGDITLEAPRGHLRFEGAAFRFPDSDTDVLHGVDLDVRPGETVAIVGATGAGKTVLTGLIPRLQDVTGGRVTIDGVDVRDLTIDSLRSTVATAFEDPTLFSMSARENLSLGRPGASDAEIADAIETAQAQFVYDLPWGLDTRIGEQGMALSGGQRQRLALARAVVAEPRILVLDDTLSALDVHTEALVERALRNVLADATGIVVAHRASTVLLADKAALLQGGTITHVGQHSELLANVPAYRALLAADAEAEVGVGG